MWIIVCSEVSRFVCRTACHHVEGFFGYSTQTRICLHDKLAMNRECRIVEKKRRNFARRWSARLCQLFTLFSSCLIIAKIIVIVNNWQIWRTTWIYGKYLIIIAHKCSKFDSTAWYDEKGKSWNCHLNIIEEFKFTIQSHSFLWVVLHCLTNEYKILQLILFTFFFRIWPNFPFRVLLFSSFFRLISLALVCIHLTRCDTVKHTQVERTFRWLLLFVWRALLQLFFGGEHFAVTSLDLENDKSEWTTDDFFSFVVGEFKLPSHLPAVINSNSISLTN